MKNIYKVFLIAFALVLYSCSDELDINRDPNTPGNITTELALASAQASLTTVTGGDLTNLGGFWAQYHTQAPTAGQYENIDQYNINATYSDRLWTELYAGCLNDLKYVIDEGTANGETGNVMVATALRAYTFQLLTDLYGDVPYAEALQGETNITPAPTSQQEIYAGLLTELDAAVGAYNADPVDSGLGIQDQIFEGDLNLWVQFINTLKLKMHLRLAYTSDANPAAVLALLAENNFLAQDAAFTNFGIQLNQRNPFYEVQIATTGLGDVNNVASNTLHDFYSTNADPRLTAVYRPTGAGLYPAIPQGSGNEFNNTAVNYARPNIGAQTPVFLIAESESYFLQAEAAVRYAGGTGAQDLYNAGVAASFATYAQYFGLTGANPATFTGAGGAYEYVAGGGVETELRQIFIQKWAALAYVNNIEAYIETTRTKFPEVVEEGTEDYSIGNRIPSRISVFTGTQVPSILFYSEDEVVRNPNLTQHANLLLNVWWDQKPE
ncbi:MAG: SusD/RagB family nutrient-binding outer membrane lipoprotein [Flavobacterium psychrophilum]|nr:MAG: SusD/RagB family nutrient-binding outer membrane lipoprotein [Flavobacterium psychrophilum]